MIVSSGIKIDNFVSMGKQIFIRMSNKKNRNSLEWIFQCLRIMKSNNIIIQEDRTIDENMVDKRNGIKITEVHFFFVESIFQVHLKNQYHFLDPLIHIIIQNDCVH